MTIVGGRAREGFSEGVTFKVRTDKQELDIVGRRASLKRKTSGTKILSRNEQSKN